MDRPVVFLDACVLYPRQVRGIVLRMAEGKQRIIGRNQIDEIRASKVSLMPEGVEKDVKIQDMADLLEFLKSRT